MCASNQVSKDTNIQHINPSCDCWTVSAPVDEIIMTLREGGNPVLRIGTDNDYKLSLSVRSSKRNSFVAISHVWKDGLGSPYSNAITQCQLTRIADRLGNLESTESCGELNIWIDTLCIPVGSEYQEFRDIQITRRNQVYKEAYAVMLMDADTLRMPSRPVLEELGMRLYLSAWASRLWTYQVGALNARVLVMTSDDVFDVDDPVNKRLRSDEKNDALQHNLVFKLTWKIVFSLGRHFQTLRVRERVDWATQATLLAVSDRTSSRVEDEAVVIGTFLGLDLAAVLAAEPEKTMGALLKAMPFVPANVLFAVGPRLQHPGLRWAPATFLRSQGGYASQIVDELVAINLHQLEEVSKSPRPMSRLDPEGRELLTFNPAIRIKRMFRPDGPESISLMFELFDRLFAIYGVPPDIVFDNEKRAIRNREIVNRLTEGEIWRYWFRLSAHIL